MSGRNPWPGGHGAGDVLDAVFLLGGGAEVHPLPLLPLCPGESPKSSDWAAASLPAEGAVLGPWEGGVLHLLGLPWRPWPLACGRSGEWCWRRWRSKVVLVQRWCLFFFFSLDRLAMLLLRALG
jgi:hypothetical protein